MEYIKLPKTIEEQVNLLQERGLIIDDKDSAERYLKNISYYHLSSYFKFFQNGDDSFLSGKSFEDVLNIYVFDQKLRLLLLDILERIEKSFKCLVYEISIKTGNPFWIADQTQFRTGGDYYRRILKIWMI
jgi:abortive infection bacteriophage resistance protein